jgi:uncharacterized protein YndB with AHSA1/START domain
MTAEPAAAVHRERAWEAITDPGQLSRWLADEVELEPQDGGAAVFRWEDRGTRVSVVENAWTPRMAKPAACFVGAWA